MGKKLGLILLMAVACNVYADTPHHEHEAALTGTINNYFSTNRYVNDIEKDAATNKAFAGLNFDKGTRGLQWACGFGFNKSKVGKACGLGFLMDGDTPLMVNGAVGDNNTGNIAISGTF